MLYSLQIESTKKLNSVFSRKVYVETCIKRNLLIQLVGVLRSTKEGIFIYIIDQFFFLSEDS